MKNPLKKISFLFVAFLITCNSNAQVNSDYDKNTDFTKYKTVSFGGWEKESDKILNDFDKKRITDALTNEFNSRGINLVESNGDATITLYLVIQTKSNITAYTNFNGGLGYTGRWGYGRGFYGGMGSATTSLSENDYRVGTLVIDMYDTAEKKLIWQGDMTTDVQEKSQKREKTIPKNIGKLMKKFPIAPLKK
ncbi:DUF4136 domain-containing protein [Xanthomarina spongicola]|uniref:Uncharacterized protein DUF4136 n=1 Tax=Xanthomarina spongicola TaxID=570520 RepID=A0A316DTD6_9FLAO|nr:DUF4136 domain-containing protein [Xanthomarina spongicola]PWK21056.1 uncharacterized protein DUF4136 [Xanthomarina spongicola]